MKIVVLVKQVPDPEARVSVAPGGGPDALQVEDRWCTSFFDEVALEAALGLRQRHGGEVVAVTAGATARATDALRRALAFGADRVLQIEAPALASADGLGFALALAAFIRREQPDLVLAGCRALDDEAGFVGPAVAELLDWPHAGGAVEVEVDLAARRARVKCTVDGGHEVLDLPLPALLAVQKGLAVPRVPQVAGVMKAMRAKIDKVGLEELGLSPADVAPRTVVLGFRPPPSRKPVRMIDGPFPENVRMLAELLRDEAKVL